MSKIIGYRADIDGLRALAVVPVVLHHAEVPGFSGGYIGVDIFFVISGFLITGIIAREMQQERFSILGFYERRARRILPALMTVLMGTIIFGLFVLSPSALMKLGAAAAATALFVSNIWFWRASVDYFGTNAELDPLLHTWSLAVEEQFYIIVPIMLILIHRYLPRRVMFGIASISLLSFLCAIFLVPSYPSAAFYVLPTRLWELGVGALLALGTIAAHSAASPEMSTQPVVPSVSWTTQIVSAAGLIAIVVPVVVYMPETPFPGWAALTPCLGTAAIIWAGSNAWVNRLLTIRPLVWIGLISYSLYLWHWPILAYLRVIYIPEEIPHYILALAILSAVVFATLSLHFIERPFRDGRLRKLSRPALLSGSAAALAGVVGLGGLIIIADGFSTLMPSKARAAYAALDDHGLDKLRCNNKSAAKGFCSFGASNDDVGEIDILLWGDSHAAALRPGVNAYLEQIGQRGLSATLNGCAPLLAIERAENESLRSCSSFNTEVVETLQSRADISTVILAGRWAFVSEGTRVGAESGRPVRFVDQQSEVKGEDNLPYFERGLSRTVNTILTMGRNVILIGSVPEIGWHVPELLGRYHRLGIEVPAVPDIDDFRRRNTRVNAVLQHLAQQPSVSFIQLASQLCKPDCTIAVGETPLYVDDDHLSRTGAESVLPGLLNDVVKTPTALQ